MIARETIAAAIDRYCRVQTDKDKAGWDALFADEVLHEDPVGIGRVGDRAHVTGAFWDHIVRNDVAIWLVEPPIICGNEAMAILACTVGPADARRTISPVVDHLRFTDDGRISMARGFYNLM